MVKRKLAIILGSGFSCESRLPPTKDLSANFLQTLDTSSPLDKAISKILKSFWKDVFGYHEGDPKQLPSLEDHFTMLDLAANSGHHLSAKYSPKKLRAIRRISIHRIFQILDAKYKKSQSSKRFLNTLLEKFRVSIVTLNWDIVVEKLLVDRKICYGIDVDWLPNSQSPQGEKVPLLKMHGSSNWLYCDSCRQIHAGLGDKAALHAKAFLELDDFALFDLTAPEVSEVKTEIVNSSTERKCSRCMNQLAGRLATFSYQKAFSINQFQTIWDKAHAELRRADSWLFVGYSMPQADFEFKHLLKSAQLGRNSADGWQCDVILKKDSGAGSCYQKFFGVNDEAIHQEGLAEWVRSSLDDFSK